jgi:non-specific serine/threonine protein kinase/serine/threonine-protein kinase
MAAAMTLLVWSGVSAELGRRRSERLFGQLRAMANFVINDLDAKMQESPLDARRAVLEKAVTYLDGLAKEAHGDSVLQLEAANGYRHIADLQGNLFRANVGRPEDALATADKALQLSQAVWNRDHADANAREVLARSHQSVGHALLQARGDLAGAFDHYQKAIDVAAGNRAATIDLWSNIAMVHAIAGNPAAAAESYRKVEALVSESLSTSPNDRVTRKQLAFVRERIATFSMQAGESAGPAEQASLSAIAIYEEVPAKSRGARRNIAMAYKTLAEAQKRLGKLDSALPSVSKSLADSRQLLHEDPKDLQAGRDISQELVLLIDVLQRGGHAAEARNETSAALEWLKPLAPLDSYYLENYVTLLVKTPFPELRSPGEALASALTAVSRDRNPETLDLLARAYSQDGKISDAIATERAGLALLPPAIPAHPMPENRGDMEAFLSALQTTGIERERHTGKAAQ